MAIGGAHQFAHIIPVACEVERLLPGAVTIFVPSHRDARALGAFLSAIGEPMLRVTVMTLPRSVSFIGKVVGKVGRLLAWRSRLVQADVILCAERTSTILARTGRDCPPILHIPHGAGDRAVGFEPRFAYFDEVFVAGRKDRDRLLADGRVPEDRCTVAGPVKLATVLKCHAQRARLFDNDRKTILYNPHFSKQFGSLPSFGKRLAEAVMRDGRYNLVIAPHIRMARSWSARRRREWEALAVPGQIRVDLGSERGCDMTYTLGADIYVGDVSSQVYEFLVHPRPCLFIDVAGTAWRDCDNFAMWHFGEVVGADVDVIAAVDRAIAAHGAYAAWQKERMAYAIQGIAWMHDGTPRIDGQSPAVTVAQAVVARAEWRDVNIAA
ncbi:glycosyl transferase [Novosphingobium sp. 9]|uniref:glycosyl transferase n=1 Tax=Novosphingobium sp. 9 TaxID=2025349 RepID=UPI0021B5006C|nr:glycosyl transferase [Novosphingobium sp. 9]